MSQAPSLNMVATFLPLLLLSTLLPAVNAADPRLARRGGHEMGKGTFEEFEKSGTCFDYFGGAGRYKAAGPCKKYCKEEHDSDSHGCKGHGLEKDDVTDWFIDDDGDEWIPGECECDFPVIEEIAKVVAEGLAKLDNIICAVMLSAFETVAEIGLSFIPGGQSVAAMRLAVQGAKTFAENGLGAANFFGDWIGAACGTSDWNFDPTDVFNPLTKMPDSLGTSKGCVRKGKKGCKKVDPVPDRPKDKPPKDKPTDKPEKSSKDSTPSSTASPSPSPTPDSCKLGKRGGKDDDKCNAECHNIKAWEPEIFSDIEKRDVTYANLEKRDTKTIRVCGISVETDNFPSGGSLTGTSGVGKDVIYALKDPMNCGNFDFGRRENKMFGTVYKNLNRDQTLASEHVIEAQLIGQFFQDLSKDRGQTLPDPHDSSGSKKVDLCKYIEAYWSDKDDNPLPDIKGTKKQAAKWLADQYPTTKNWPEEFLLLPTAINSMKEKVWNGRVRNAVGKKFITEPLAKDDVKQKQLEDSATVKAIIKYKDMMSLYQYHTEPEVVNIFKKQSKRIADMLGQLDDVVSKLKFDAPKKPGPKFERGYESQDLKKEWNKWIKKHADDSMKKVDDFFKQYRGEYNKAAKRMHGLDKKKMNPNERDKYEKVVKYLGRTERMYGRIMGNKWQNPF